MNQIVPKNVLKITKGEGSLKAYTYKGDSGMSAIFKDGLTTAVTDISTRQGGQLLLLPELHHPRLPPPGKNHITSHLSEEEHGSLTVMMT